MGILKIKLVKATNLADKVRSKQIQITEKPIRSNLVEYETSFVSDTMCWYHST